MSAPSITYNIDINGTPITLGTKVKLSLKEDRNIHVVASFSAGTVHYLEARVSSSSDPDYDTIKFDIDYGRRLKNSSGNNLVWSGNLTSPIEFNIPLSSANFGDGKDSEYTVALMARNNNDGLWDITRLFVTSSSELYKPTDYDEFHVFADDDVPLT